MDDLTGFCTFVTCLHIFRLVAPYHAGDAGGRDFSNTADDVFHFGVDDVANPVNAGLFVAKVASNSDVIFKHCGNDWFNFYDRTAIYPGPIDDADSARICCENR